MESIRERNCGIDCLRIVLMFMVCVLHALGQGGVLRTCIHGTLNWKVYWFIEILCYCAVDGFAIISGYIASNKSRNYYKLVDFWMQAFFYSFILTMILTFVLDSQDFNSIDVKRSLFPVTFSYYWYFTAYFALFIITPILDKYLFSIDEKTSKKLFLVIFLLFSVMSIKADPFTISSGYSSLWLMILYSLGVIAKKIKLFDTKSNTQLIIMYILCVSISWGVYIIKGSLILINYVSPTILMCGLIIVIFFSRMKFKSSFVSKLSTFTFGIYLFQLNNVIWDKFIFDSLSFIVDESIVLGIIYVLISTFLIFVSGLLIECFRYHVFKLLKFSVLSKKIVKLAEHLIDKMTVLLN